MALEERDSDVHPEEQGEKEKRGWKHSFHCQMLILMVNFQ